MRNQILDSIILTAFLLLGTGCKDKVSVTQPDNPSAGIVLYVDSNPQGISILLDDMNTGKFTPDTIKGLEPGLHKISLVSDIFIDVEFGKILSANSFSEIFWNFLDDERNYGTAIISDGIRYQMEPTDTGYDKVWPEEVNFYINDSLIDINIPDTLRLLAGNYTFRETASEHREYSTNVLIEGEIITNVKMEPQDTSISVDYNKDNSAMPGYKTTCVEIDKDGIVWIGNNPGGITKYYNNRFTTYDHRNSIMQSYLVTCMAVDEKNTKWIGTRIGLVSIDDNENMKIYTTDNTPLPVDNVECLTLDDNDNLWVGLGNITTARCIAKFDGESWEYWEIPDYRAPRSLAVRNQNPSLWVGLDMGFMLFDNGVWSRPDGIDSPSVSNSIREHPVHSILVDHNENLWLSYGNMGRSKGFLVLYDGNDFQSKNIGPTAKLFIAANGDIWVPHYDFDMDTGTFTGSIIYKFIFPTYTSSSYKKNLLRCSSSNFSDLAIHPNGDLWAASRDKGIIKIKIAKIE